MLAPAQVEVILSIAALEKGLYTVVSASLVGSILSNLLLVLGALRALGWSGDAARCRAFSAAWGTGLDCCRARRVCMRAGRLQSAAPAVLRLSDVAPHRPHGPTAAHAAGCCMLFGGFYFKTQSFNAMGNRVCSSLLFLAVIGIVMPTAAYSLTAHKGTDDSWIVDISRVSACILLAM